MPANLKDALAEAGLVSADDAAGVDAGASSAADASNLIGVEQFRPGVVVLDLDPVMLLEDSRVTLTQPNPATRSGPFLCVGVEASGFCSWAGLTSAVRWERLELRPWWRIGGGARWRDSRQFLTDAGALWRGPREAFAAAAWRETFNDPETVPRLTEQGLGEVLKRMATERHRRQAPRNLFGTGRHSAERA